MPLKLTITKKEHDALSDALKSEYKAHATEKETYVLDVSDLEDTGALKRAKDHERDQRKKAESEASDLKAKLAAAEAKLEENKPADDPKADEKKAAEDSSWKAKFEKFEAESKEREAKAQARLERQAVTQAAKDMAVKLGGDKSEIILPHIEKRLYAETNDEKTFVKVYDSDGETSAITIEELSKEFVDNPTFASILVGSKGSGSGADGDPKKPGGSGGATKLSEMTATEEAKFANENPVEYDRMITSENAA